MAKVILKDIEKIFPGDVVAVKDFNLEVKDKEFVVLVGPSGCGKSTTLRIIAGLEEPTKGEVYIDDLFVNYIPPKDRDIAMVFQSYALYPHMKVYDNMAFGLKLKKEPKEEIDRRVKEAAQILGMKQLLDRKPKELSGGQKQRVAVGRAIVRKPKVFLFDEPLSNLDAKLRVEMRGELKKLHARLQATMIYVTHDQVEAMTMGDKIVVLKDGFIQQIGPPLLLYDRPLNKFVAGFIGSPSMNFMDCKVIKSGENFYLDEGNFRIRLNKGRDGLLNKYSDKEVILGIRPADIYLLESRPDNIPSQNNVISASLEFMEPMGGENYLHLNTGKHIFQARILGDPVKALEMGRQVKLVMDTNKIHLFDKETEKAVFIEEKVSNL